MLNHQFESNQKPVNVVILGSNGFIGKSLSLKLKSKGLNVTNISRNNIDLLNPNASNLLRDHLKKNDVLIATSAVAPCKNSKMFLENIKIAVAICEAVNKSNCSQVINISSDAVYADVDTHITENTLQAPDNFHGIMHLARELIFKERIKNSLATVRPTLIYGPGDTHNGYGPNQFSRLVKENKPITLFGKGEEKRDHVFIDDVTETILRIIYKKSTGTINIATGKVKSFLEIAEKTISTSGKNIEIIFTGRKGPMPHNGYRPFDISSYKKAFPDFSFTTFDKGIAETVNNI